MLDMNTEFNQATCTGCAHERDCEELPHDCSQGYEYDGSPDGSLIHQISSHITDDHRSVLRGVKIA